MQCDANRTVKSNRLLPSIDAKNLNCGITALQFSKLIEYATSLGPGRRDKQHEVDRVFKWLTTAPSNGRALTNFQQRVEHTDIGADLWRFFQDLELEDLRRQGYVIRREVSLEEEKQRLQEEHQQALELQQQQEQQKRRQPSVETKSHTRDSISKNSQQNTHINGVESSSKRSPISVIKSFFA